MDKHKLNQMNTTGASVLSVNISKIKGTVKDPVKSAELKTGHGIVGDAHAGDWHRQVSLLAVESIEKMIDKGFDNLSPGIFAENITTKGIELHTLPVGTRLKIGGTLHEVTQIGKQCHNSGCAIKQATGECVMPTEGIFTRVLEEGMVTAGDCILVIEQDDL